MAAAVTMKRHPAFGANGGGASERPVVVRLSPTANLRGAEQQRLFDGEQVVRRAGTRLDRAAERRAEQARAEALWPTFWVTRERETRNAIALAYAPLVEVVIARLADGLRANWSRQDLHSFGMLGLIEAIDRFEAGSEPGRFPAYAMLRIRGAIVDEVRRADWLPRSVRSRASAYRSSAEELSGTLGREARPEEIARAMGLHPSAGAAIRKDAEARLVRLDAPVATAGVQGADELAGDASLEPEQQLLGAEEVEQLRAAIIALPDRLRTVISLRYFGNISQRQLGEMLGVTHSRVCQLEGQALRELRRVLRG